MAQPASEHKKNVEPRTHSSAGECVQDCINPDYANGSVSALRP